MRQPPRSVPPALQLDAGVDPCDVHLAPVAERAPVRVLVERDRRLHLGEALSGAHGGDDGVVEIRVVAAKERLKRCERSKASPQGCRSRATRPRRCGGASVLPSRGRGPRRPADHQRKQRETTSNKARHRRTRLEGTHDGSPMTDARADRKTEVTSVFRSQRPPLGSDVQIAGYARLGTSSARPELSSN